MELFHPFAQVFDDYCCKANNLEHKPDSLSQQKAQVYRHLDSLIHLHQDTIYDMFDEIIEHSKDYLLEKSSVKQTSRDVQQIIRFFVVEAEAHPGDYAALDEEVYVAFKWAFEKYKEVGGRATRKQWIYG